jgi:aminoglycoside 6'-N-acetyltransferase I
MNTRPVEPADEAESLQMRAALWSDQEPTESGRTVRQFLVAPDPALQPMLHAVLVCPRATGGLCGFVELSIRPYAEGCETNRVGYIEVERIVCFRKALSEAE